MKKGMVQSDIGFPYSFAIAFCFNARWINEQHIVVK